MRGIVKLLLVLTSYIYLVLLTRIMTDKILHHQNFASHINHQRTDKPAITWPYSVDSIGLASFTI